MGIVFDEVIGHVESERAPSSQEPASSAPAAPPPSNQPSVEQMLRRLNQRAARLQAD